MNDLTSLMEPNLKRREDYVTAQNVAGSMTGKESNLPSETRACSQQLDFQIEEKDLDGPSQRAYAFRASAGYILNSEQPSMLRTEHRIDGTGI